MTLPPPARPDLPQPRQRAVDAPGATLAVVEVGSPDAPAWVVAHGAGSSARFVVEALAGPVVRAGRRLVTYDLRGHGASSPARHTRDHHLDVHAADLAHVAASSGDTGSGDTIEVVGGISLGAHAAVRAVADGARCEVALACLPAWTGRAVPGRGPHAAIAARVAEVGVAGHLAAIRDDHDLPGWLRDTLLADLAGHDAASLAAVLTALDGGLAPTAEELVALPVPLAVVGWPDDPGHPLDVAERWAASAVSGHRGVASMAAMGRGVDHLGAVAVTTVSATVSATVSPARR